jgi:hypothetical protein
MKIGSVVACQLCDGRAAQVESYTAADDVAYLSCGHRDYASNLHTVEF